MSKFDTNFLEIGIDFERLDRFPEDDAIWYETPEEMEMRYKKEDKKEQILPLIMDIIENELTEMQRTCIKMYFLNERTREDIANHLGIPRRVVTQHIYGIVRNGKRIGGGIPKIRKMCEKKNISL
ncbi:MAG: RNA polymerase sigma factor [bacterium]